MLNFVKIEIIKKIAEKENWKFLEIQDKPPMISFKKEEARINIYYSTMTIGTCIRHPKKGKTQLFRRNVTLSELEKIFKNPRIHTTKGYYYN